MGKQNYFFSGITDILILAILCEHDSYVYEIVKFIKEKYVETHTDTLGGMVAEVKGNGRLRLTALGGMNPNNAETENCVVIRWGEYRRNFS